MCTAENDSSTCITSCNGKREFVSGECRCNNGTYDDGENNTCADCHYSWLLYYLFF